MKQKSVAHNMVTFIVLFFFVLIIGAIIYLNFVEKTALKSEVPAITESEVSNFLDCIVHKKAFISDDENSGIICRVEGGTFTANSLIHNTCSIVVESDDNLCSSIHDTYDQYCKTQYSAGTTGSTQEAVYEIDDHDGLYRPSTRGLPRVHDEFVHSRFRCVSADKASDKSGLLDVYLRKSENGDYEPYLTIDEPKFCKKIDGKGIPYALSLICYDESEAKWRVAKK